MTIDLRARRVHLLDELRGFCILAMVVYHAAYDGIMLLGWQLPFFFSDWFNLVRDIFAGCFVWISGAVSRYSHSNLKRGSMVFGIALLLTAGTALLPQVTTIAFGILHMLGLCMILFALLRPLFDRIPPMVGLVISGLLFLLCFGIPKGYFSIPFVGEFDLPYALYAEPYWFWLGFPSPGFSSSDYFPLLPWMLLFFCGSFGGVYLQRGRFPAFFYASHCRFFSAVGKQTLWIYILHQPVVYGLFSLIAMMK